MTKNKQAELLNDTIIELGINQTGASFKKFYNTVISLILSKYSEDVIVTKKQIKEIIKNVQIDTKSVELNVQNSMVISGITTVNSKKRLDRQEVYYLGALLLVVATLPKNNPKLLGSKINYINKAIANGNMSKLSANNLKVAKNLKKYYNINRVVLKKQINSAKINMVKIEKSIKSNLTKTVFKDMRKEINKSELIDGKKVYQTTNKIKTKVKAKYDNQVEWRVRRTLDTELHRIEETSKHAHHLKMGYTHKIWITQQDKKVRDSHAKLNGKKIKVDKKFRVGASWGLYPSDPSLSAKESINCRCFLKYIKEANS